MLHTGAGRDRVPEGGITLLRQVGQKIAPQWRQLRFGMTPSKRTEHPAH